MLGCRETPTTTWSEQARSPDGMWLAVARSEQGGACRRGLRCHHGIPEADQWSTTSHPSLIVLSRVCNDEFEDGMVNSDAPERYVRAEYASWGSRRCQLPGRQVRRYRHLHLETFLASTTNSSPQAKRQLILVRRSVGVVAANNGPVVVQNPCQFQGRALSPSDYATSGQQAANCAYRKSQTGICERLPISTKPNVRGNLGRKLGTDGDVHQFSKTKQPR